jgi:hypothetical protein
MVPFVPEPSPCAQELRLTSRSVLAEGIDRKSSASLDFVLDIHQDPRIRQFLQVELNHHANLTAGCPTYQTCLMATVV